MPDAALHSAFGREVREALDGSVASRLADAPYTMALFGPDTWFPHKPWVRRTGRGRRMHTTKTGEFLMALADRAKTGSCRDLMFSYLAGFLCHYALDSVAHPYIIRMTTETYRGPGCHRTFEHSLDVLEMTRAGVWGERHPVTRRYFPRVKLPREMAAELDAAYGKVYGWKNCRRAQNFTAGVYRLLYRIMENPKGLIALLARLTGSMKLRSVAYAESYLNGEDVENLAGKPWRASHDPSSVSDETFPRLRARAKTMAAELIAEAAKYVYTGETDRDALAAKIGSRSYLSGLDALDPRNWDIPALLPSDDPPAAGE